VIKISHQIRTGLFGLTFLFSGLAQAQSVQAYHVPSSRGGYCKDILVRNLSSRRLAVTVHYTVKGADGSSDSGSLRFPAAVAMNDAWGYSSDGLVPGQEAKQWIMGLPIDCNVNRTVSVTSYDIYDVTAHNERAKQAEDAGHAERRALGTMIDNWNNEGKQRKQERDAQKRAEAARLAEEEKRRKQQEYRQTMERQMESARRDGEKTMGEIQAWRARQEAEHQAERQRIQAEMARGQAEREAYNREAQAKATRAQAEWQAQQAAAQRAAQAEQARQAALAAERAAKERRRQEQWQQQVNLTSSLLQGSIQNSENALAASRAQLNETVSTYDTEDKALADIIAKAKATAQNKK
jgi:hypothetical protein